MTSRYAQQVEFDFSPTPESEAAEAVDGPEVKAECTASAAMIERIIKLLRLAADQRGNPHEAERAAGLAFELAERHHVDIASLNLGEEVEKLIGEYFPLGKRLDRIADGALRVVRSYFHVEVMLSFPRVLFVGRETDVAVAGYMFDFLRRVAKDCLKSYEKAEIAARRKVTTGKRANYVAGFFYGISHKLRGARESAMLGDSKAALVLAEKTKRQAKMEEMVPSKNRTSHSLRDVRKNSSALGQGFVAGESTEIHRPIGHSKPVMALGGPR